jgi:hypothetical protein
MIRFLHTLLFKFVPEINLETNRRFTMQVRVVSFQKHKRLSIVQFLTAQQNTFEYISGPKAINEDQIQVKEVSQSGSVNNLFLFNLSNMYVFFMDGDILTGAKQNRVLNTSVMVAPNSKITLPVSCVEQGRWSAISDKFNTSDYISPQKLRAKKSRAVEENLRFERSHMAEQNEVWNDVESYSVAYKVKSPSMSLSDVFDSKKEDFDGFVKKFPVNHDANGLAIFTDKQLLNVDIFNRTDVYQEYFPKILRSTAMEVSQLKEKGNEITEAEAAFKTVNLFDNLEKIEYTVHPGVGVGEEKRFDSKELTGFELNFKNHLIHLTLLNLEKDITGKSDGNRRRRIR